MMDLLLTESLNEAGYPHRKALCYLRGSKISLNEAGSKEDCVLDSRCAVGLSNAVGASRSVLIMTSLM